MYNNKKSKYLQSRFIVINLVVVIRFLAGWGRESERVGEQSSLSTKKTIFKKKKKKKKKWSGGGLRCRLQKNETTTPQL